jgi:hypothetical protein
MRFRFSPRNDLQHSRSPETSASRLARCRHVGAYGAGSGFNFVRRQQQWKSWHPSRNEHGYSNGFDERFWRNQHTATLTITVTQ